jgi:TrmH family RNA methyltransferase
MVSKGQIKLIAGLEQKKGRTKNGLFVVEGKKGIAEILASAYELEMLYTTEDLFGTVPEKTQIVTEEELKKISRLKTPQTAVALFKIPAASDPQISGLTVALDGVRDPGNLGTIIRLCDWFGVDTLICSKDTVDCYNPKVVQASMGSLGRVKVAYTDLKEFLKKGWEKPILGAFLEGRDVYSVSLPQSGILLMGNEANGISEEVEKLVSEKISIPQFSAEANTESLNVTTATAILLSEFSQQASPAAADIR